MTKCSRAAIVATINSHAVGSAWIAIPVDDLLLGNRLVFVHRKACALFGNIRSADLFDRHGGASCLAENIHRIGCEQNLTAGSPTMTACPILVEAAESHFSI